MKKFAMKSVRLVFNTKVVSALIITLVSASVSFAACDGGRVPCANKCEQSQRARGCKDSRNPDPNDPSRPYCTTPAFCKNKDIHLTGCTDGWQPRARKCSKRERAEGCRDKRAANGELCIKYYSQRPGKKTVKGGGHGKLLPSR